MPADPEYREMLASLGPAKKQPSTRKKRSRLKLSVADYKALILKVFQRDNYKCRICTGRKPLSAHHVKFRSQGGDDMECNLLSVCTRCHEAVHSRHLIVTQGDQTKNIDTNKPTQFISVNGWRP